MSEAIFTDTVTIYNHYKDKWFRTVLEGVQWKDKVTKSIDAEGKMHIVPEVSLTVPIRNGYVEPEQYQGKDFTFGLDNLDIVVLGKCTKEITEEYTITKLRKEFDNTATICAVSDNTMRRFLKHWRVMAK